MNSGLVSFIGRCINTVLGWLGFQLIFKDRFHLLMKNQVSYANDWLYTYHSADFMEDPLFKEAYRLGKATDKGLLLQGKDIQWRVHLLCWAASHASKLEGDFVDCGVSTGIFARSIIHYTNFNETGKTYYLLDTFQGMDPKYSSDEEMAISEHLKYDDETRDRYKEVQALFDGFNVNIIKGSIPETLPLVTAEKISLLNIDLNSALPEYEALNYFWDKLVSGGMIVLDDFGYLNVNTAQRDIHRKFAKEKGVEILYMPTCQGVIIKP